MKAIHYSFFYILLFYRALHIKLIKIYTLKKQEPQNKRNIHRNIHLQAPGSFSIVELKMFVIASKNVKLELENK
jgi:hypothetical protein